MAMPEAPDKAIEYAKRAGDRALALLADEEAARLYRLALRIVDATNRPDTEARAELLLALADVQTRAGASPSAKETLS